jgi:hypothetical protein
MKFKTLALLVIFSAVTVGCGGGNMNGSTPPSNNGLTTPPTNILGTWTGTLTDSFGNNGEPMTVEFVFEHGNAPYTTGAGLKANVNVEDVVGGGNCAFNNISGVLGQITPGNQPTGTVTFTVAIGDGAVPHGTFTGSLTRNNTITGTWTEVYGACAGASAGHFTLTK